MAKLVAAGVTLRSQINARFPGRDKASDGWVGDKAHQSRQSDHNPDKDGWVHALDIDENMGKGIWRGGRAAMKLAEQLRQYAASGLPGADRIKYIVYENALASGTYRKSWWKWRAGKWGHTMHIHVSFTPKAQSDGRLFPLPILATNRQVRQVWQEQLDRAVK